MKVKLALLLVAIASLVSCQTAPAPTPPEINKAIADIISKMTP